MSTLKDGGDAEEKKKQQQKQFLMAAPLHTLLTGSIYTVCSSPEDAAVSWANILCDCT